MQLTLAVWLLSALAIVGACVVGARQTRVEREVRGRGALRRFSSDLQHELHRLERTYEADLARLAGGALLNDRQEIWKQCDRLVGIRQFSLIHRAVERSLDLHVPLPMAPQPEPTFSPESAAVPKMSLVLSEEELLRGEETNGWLEEPGQPLLYWQRRSPDECVVLLIDEAAVAQSIETYLQPWIEAHFAPVRAAGGPDRLTAPDDRVSAAVGDPGSAEADLVLPLRTRFGTWQLASWDRRQMVVSYRSDVLLAGGGAGVLLVLLGLFVSAREQRALRLAEQRVSFVNAVSHELRAPLTNILLNVEIAAEAVGEEGVAAERLRLAREEAHRLGRLIENVLTFSRRDQPARGAAEQAVSPIEVARAVTQQFQPAFERRGLTLGLHGEVSEPCAVDPEALTQILSNLLSNVEKHVPAGGAQITLSRENGTLCVSVSDTGPGIPPSEAERIFEPFVQLDARTDARASGTGLGLAISRDLARAMGGTLGVAPADHGAHFILRVPAPLS